MADHGRHTGIVQIAGDEDGRVGIGIVVPLDQLQGAALHSPLGVDLLHGQLGGPLHGNADGIAQRAGQADSDGLAREMARSHHHDEQSGQHFLHRFRTMPDWTDRSPDATFDLHGQTVLEAVTNAERFLRAQARARPGGVVRLITGRGRAGGGAPVRTRIRSLLRALKESGGVVRDFLLEDTDGSYLVRLWG